MLHRMALRVLPSLTLAVTEPAVRKQKRLVMLVPGLVAFALYRVAKHLLPLAEPVVLLTVSGMVGLMTAVLAYRAGRATAWVEIIRADGRWLLLWMAGWIGLSTLFSCRFLCSRCSGWWAMTISTTPTVPP